MRVVSAVAARERGAIAIAADRRLLLLESELS